MSECQHEVCYGGLCVQCGHSAAPPQAPGDGALAYSHALLQVSSTAAQRMDQENISRLTQQRRLVLVLDIDHTLLHTTDDHRAAAFMHSARHTDHPASAQADPALSGPTDGLPCADGSMALAEPVFTAEGEELHSFYLPGMPNAYVIKLRPHLREFLATVARKYELHMYTMGGGQYAKQVQRILDPDGKLFQERITSRDDFPEGRLNRKNLRRLFPYDDSLVVIVDDREDVWARHPGQPVANLLRVRPYHFFRGLSEAYDRTAPAGSAAKQAASVAGGRPVHELVGRWRESDQADKMHMLRAARVLDECHRRFYAEPPQPARDTKAVLTAQLAELLRGCRLAFTGVFSGDPKKADMWQLARRLGAQCFTEVDGRVTHLVTHPGRGQETVKANVARQLGCVFMVTPEWLSESAHNFKRESEIDHALDKPALPQGLKLDDYRRRMAEKQSWALAQWEQRQRTSHTTHVQRQASPALGQASEQDDAQPPAKRPRLDAGEGGGQGEGPEEEEEEGQGGSDSDSSLASFEQYLMQAEAAQQNGQA